jgi:hypothetical protein
MIIRRGGASRVVKTTSALDMHTEVSGVEAEESGVCREHREPGGCSVKKRIAIPARLGA